MHAVGDWEAEILNRRRRTREQRWAVRGLDTQSLNHLRISRRGSWESGEYRDVCTPVFVFIWFRGVPEGLPSRECAAFEARSNFSPPFLS